MTPEATIAIVAIFMSVLLSVIAFWQADHLSRKRRRDRSDDGFHGMLFRILKEKACGFSSVLNLEEKSGANLHKRSIRSIVISCVSWR